MTQFSFQISLVKCCSCGLGDSNSHGNIDSKMADRKAMEIETAKWRTDQPRKQRQQNGGPNSHGNSDGKMADLTATEIATAKWRT